MTPVPDSAEAAYVRAAKQLSNVGALAPPITRLLPVALYLLLNAMTARDNFACNVRFVATTGQVA